ncbi:MAG: cation:proton antiporter [Bradymonadaceae bacterium]
MEFFYSLLVLLVVTRVCGELAERLGQPALLGELISGILLGLFVVHQFPSAIPAVANGETSEVFIALTDLGVFFLMLYAGVEMDPGELVADYQTSLAVALGGTLVPFGLGFGLGWLVLPSSELQLAQAFFLGAALAITAIPVAVKVLMDLELLHTEPGQLIVSAAIIDDVIGLVLLAVLTALIETGATPSPGAFAWLLLKISLFFLGAWLVAGWVLPLLAAWSRPLLEEEQEFSVLVIVALGFSLFAEFFGLHFILGAFTAGAFYTPAAVGETTYEDILHKTDAITFGFLAPLFFVSIGLHLDVGALTEVPVFVLGLVGIGILGKLAGAGLPVLLSGGSVREAGMVGVGMSARGAVEVVIADIALRAGLFSEPSPTPAVVEHLFSAVVIMAVVTTLFAPLGLRLVRASEGSA